MVSNREWYRLEDKAPGATEVYLFDEISYFGVTAKDFVRDLAGVKSQSINLHINSPGGDVFDGIAILNALRAHPANVNTVVDGLAASAASFIAMAGDTITMSPNSTLMIHDAAGMVLGNAEDMAKMVELLNATSNNIASIYASRAGGTADEWRERMRAETWYTAQEAVDAGLADSVGGASPSEVKNDWDLTRFRYQNRAQAPAPERGVDIAAEIRHALMNVWR